MNSLANKERNKRKRSEDYLQNEGGNGEPSRVETPLVVSGNESASGMIYFLDFRRSTLQLHPPLNWLGPGVMAVFWFKEYLKKEPFGWVQRSKQKPLSLTCSPGSNGDGLGRTDNKRRKLPNNHSKGNFYFIPGQYLRNFEEKKKRIATAKDLAIQNVLDFGTPGVHYATSYIGVYNLLRRNGKFAVKYEPNNPQGNCETDAKQQSSHFYHATGGNREVVPVHYNGPPLP